MKVKYYKVIVDLRGGDMPITQIGVTVRAKSKEAARRKIMKRVQIRVKNYDIHKTLQID
jgi:hypothetical protein